MVVKIMKIEIKKAQIKNKVPIIVGGTGLYLRSLEKYFLCSKKLMKR